MSSKKSFKLFFSVLIISLIFIFLRLYKIDQTLIFFGDLGRDFLTLATWLKTGKPPLLGPQTSVISFNQSAIYFYFLMPFYLTFNHSSYSTVYATIILYLGFYLIGMVYYKKDLSKQIFLSIIFALVTFAPEFILQSRSPWNPILAPPFFIGGFLLIEELMIKDAAKKEWLAMVAFAISLSLTYSLFPAIFVVLLLYLLKKKKFFHGIKTFAKFITALLIVNFPTFVFELRHNFLLSRSVLTQEPLQQVSLSFVKFLQLATASIDPSNILILIFAIVVLAFFITKKNEGENKFVFSCLMAVFLLQALLPFKVHSHYIFGISALFFILIAKIKSRKLQLFLISILFFHWLSPKQLKQYFIPADFTLEMKKSCAQLACRELNFPVFLTLNSDSHDHQAFGYRYLFSQAGCQVGDVTYDPSFANHLVVISENTQYESGKTDFYEISTFKPTQEIKTIRCEENLMLSVLER